MKSWRRFLLVGKEESENISVLIIDILLNEMTNLQTYRTKLDYPLWIDEKGSERKTKHNRPRLIVW